MSRTFPIALMAILASLGACAVMPPTPHEYPPHTATVALSVSPHVAYQQAYTTFAKQPGWVIVSADAAMRSFRGEVNNAAQMTVLVEQRGAGSLVTINGRILPNKIVRGASEPSSWTLLRR